MCWTSSIWCFHAHYRRRSEAAKNPDRIKSNIFHQHLFLSHRIHFCCISTSLHPRLWCLLFCLDPGNISHPIWPPALTWPPVIHPSHVTHTLTVFLYLSRSNIHTHTRTDRDINTSRGVLNVGFSRSSRCSLPGCRVTLASFFLQSGNRNAQNGSGVVPRPALGLPWLAVWPSECAFLMLPWPRWERRLVGLIVAAGPNGNKMERDGEGDGKGGGVVLLNLALSFRPKSLCSCTHSFCLCIS